jgi:hypothetical protein
MEIVSPLRIMLRTGMGAVKHRYSAKQSSRYGDDQKLEAQDTKGTRRQIRSEITVDIHRAMLPRMGSSRSST